MQIRIYKKKLYLYLILAILAFLFCLSIPSAPLYSYNQNTYFFHGLSNAGFGYLSTDWLATTKDSFPVFSKIIQYTYLFFPEISFNVYFILIKILFFLSLILLSRKLFNLDKVRIYYLSVILIFINSLAFQYYSLEKLGINLGDILTNGFANQYLLGETFQPSVFGVFLLLAIVLYLFKKSKLAICSCAIAANIHSSYLLHGLIVVLSFQLFDKGFGLRGLAINTCYYLVLCLPSSLYIISNFVLDQASYSVVAQDILVHRIIPFHADINYFFSFSEQIQLVIIASSMFLIPSRYFSLSISFAILVVTLLTIAQYLGSASFFALMFPWRLTVVFVPLAVLIISSFIIKNINNRILYSKITIIFSLFVLCETSFLSNELKINRIDFLNNQAAMPISKKILNEKKNVTYLIPPSFVEFRLDTGASTFVDNKNHPYEASSVLEWFGRLELANKFYQNLNCNILEEISEKYSIRHAIVSIKDSFNCKFWNNIYCVSSYCLFAKS